MNKLNANDSLGFEKKSQLHINFTFCESSTCWAEAALASFKVFHSWRLRHVDSSWFILYIFLLDVVRHWKCNWIPNVTSRSSIFPCLKDSDLAHSRPHCQALGTSLADSTLEDSQRFQTLEILLGHPSPAQPLFLIVISLLHLFLLDLVPLDIGQRAEKKSKSIEKKPKGLASCLGCSQVAGTFLRISSKE